MDRGTLAVNWGTTFILGAGASAAGIDITSLPGVVVGINRAAFHAPCHAFFSLDKQLIIDSAKELAAFGGDKHVCLVRPQDTPEGAVFWQRVSTTLPSQEPGTLSDGDTGCNSGLTGINLAMQKGARRIVCLGFDLDDDNRLWIPGPTRPRTRLEKVRENFARTGPWYKENGIEVVIANPESRVEGFRKAPLESVL